MTDRSRVTARGQNDLEENYGLSTTVRIRAEAPFRALAGQLLACRAPPRCPDHVRLQGRRQRLSSIETEVRRGLWIDPLGAEVRFSKWAQEWAATVVDLRPSTRARDIGYLERYLLPRFGTHALGEITHLAVRAWVADLNASGLAPSTVTKAAQMLAKIMRSAVQAGLLASSPCDGVKSPRIERTEMRFLTTAEVDTLAAAMDERYRAAVLLAAYGGCGQANSSGCGRPGWICCAGR